MWFASSCVGVLRNVCVDVQNPIQAIVQHAEHNVLYAQDPLMQGFHSRHISHMLDIVCENQGQTGFSAAEIGAGTGGFTRQVIAELDRSPFSELRSYTATDITPAFGPSLLQLVNNSKLEFKVCICLSLPYLKVLSSVLPRRCHQVGAVNFLPVLHVLMRC